MATETYEQVRSGGRAKKAVRFLQREGFRAFCSRLFRLVLDPVASTQVAYDMVLRCDEDAGVVAPAVEARLAEVSEEGLALIDSLVNVPTAEIRDRLRGGDRCFVVTVAGSPAGIAWVAFGPCGEVAPALELGPAQAYLYAVRVLPPRRRQGLGTYLESAIAARVAEEGFTELFARVASGNTGGLRAAHAAGFRIASAVRCRRRLGQTRVERVALPEKQ